MHWGQPTDLGIFSKYEVTWKPATFIFIGSSGWGGGASKFKQIFLMVLKLRLFSLGQPDQKAFIFMIKLNTK